MLAFFAAQLDFSWYAIGALGTWTGLLVSALGWFVRSIIKNEISGAMKEAMKEVEEVYARKEVVRKDFDLVGQRIDMLKPRRSHAD